MEVFPATEFLSDPHRCCFWSVAREGSLRAVAEKLRASQPSICTRIRQLEAALGEDLDRPRGRSLELTEFGQFVYGHAEQIFALGGEILRAAKQAPTSRTLRVQAG